MGVCRCPVIRLVGHATDRRPDSKLDISRHVLFRRRWSQYFFSVTSYKITFFFTRKTPGHENTNNGPVCFILLILRSIWVSIDHGSRHCRFSSSTMSVTVDIDLICQVNTWTRSGSRNRTAWISSCVGESIRPRSIGNKNIGHFDSVRWKATVRIGNMAEKSVCSCRHAIGELRCSWSSFRILEIGAHNIVRQRTFHGPLPTRQ